MKDKVINLNQYLDDVYSDMSRDNYQFDSIVDIQQFEELSKQAKFSQQKINNMKASLYPQLWQSKKSISFLRKEQQKLSQYYNKYLFWKTSEQQQENNVFAATYQSALKLTNKNEKQKQITRIVGQFNKANHQYQKDETNLQLQTIKKKYEKQLSTILNENPKKQLMVKQIKQKIQLEQKKQNLVQKQNQIQTKVHSYLMKKYKQQQEIKKKQIQHKIKLKYLQSKNFIDLIKRPPSRKKIQQSEIIPKQNQLKSTSYIQSFKSNQQLEQKRVNKKIRLNVKNILKIPYKQFLIFYSQNYRKLNALSSPEQMQQINNYRNQALKRAKALQNLRQRISSLGPQYIKNLPLSDKQRLFKILYQDQVQQQKYLQNE